MSMSIARYVCDVTKLLPGDIVLGRAAMNLDDDSTWHSHLVQTITRSGFSFSALCVAEGVCVEAVGSAVARLPVWRAGVTDIRNIQVLRPKGRASFAAKAAALGAKYLEEGFYQRGPAKPKCTAFQDMRRAALASTELVVAAYREAGLNDLFTTDGRRPGCGDLINAGLFESVTDQVMGFSEIPVTTAFNFDDESICNRLQHWDVSTQLKVICKYEIRRLLELQPHKPSSFAELELLIAKNAWKSLDSALVNTLKWYRYDKVFDQKQFQFIESLARDNYPVMNKLDLSMLDDRGKGGDLTGFEDSRISMSLRTELSHLNSKIEKYEELLDIYEAKSFKYMKNLLDVQSEKIYSKVRAMEEMAIERERIPAALLKSAYSERRFSLDH